MAISVTQLTNGEDGDVGTTFNTASITPSANNLALIFITCDNTTPPTISSVTGNGLTWVQATTPFYINTGNIIVVYRAMGASPTTGAITITFSGAVAVARWQVFNVSGVDTSGTNGSGAVKQSVTGTGSGTSHNSVTLGAFSSVNNGTMGFYYDNGATGTVTPGTGFTLLSSSNNNMNSEWRTGNSTTVDFNDAGGFPIWGLIGMEIAVPAVTTTPSSTLSLMGVG